MAGSCGRRYNMLWRYRSENRNPDKTEDICQFKSGVFINGLALEAGVAQVILAGIYYRELRSNLIVQVYSHSGKYLRRAVDFNSAGRPPARIFMVTVINKMPPKPLCFVL